MTRRLIAFAVLLGALLGGGLLFAASASAHATIVATDPVDGSRLATVPTSVTITFDEQVGLGTVGYLRVIDQSGRRVDTGTATHPGGDGTKVSATLKSGLGDSTYTASYRVISADSHPVAGALRFVVGDGALAAGPSLTGSATNSLTSKTFDVIRGLSFGALALLGGAWLMMTVWPAGRDDRRARVLVWTGWWASVFFGLAELVVQGPYDAGTGLGDIFRWNLLDATLHTDFGVAHSLRLISLGVLAPTLGTLLRRYEGVRTGLEELAGLMFVSIAVTFAVSGHATSEHPRWLATTSDSLHLLAMSAWVGGLAYLLIALLPRREPEELRQALPVFSWVAYISVATLAVTGTYQAWLGVGSWRALAVTTYGWLVLAKIALFVAMIVLGNLSRQVVARRWTSRLRAPVAYAMTDVEAGVDEPVADDADDDDFEEDPPERAEVRGLVRGVLAEVLIAAVVLGTTGVLVAQAPGSAALAIIDERPHTVTATIADGRTARITVSTQRHGSLNIAIAVGSGPAITALTATASLPAKELGPIAIPLTKSGADYAASGVLLPAAGTWVITLTVSTSQFDTTVSTAHIVLH